ncbi:MAG: putative short-chain dehydrogenase [Marinobacter excellens HL-55]|uniref:Putative short-chain dehydrogenase n=1 Tax=Marinobacter excellens HL-55 TaxID=1305731 RepID=A0A0P8CZJ4_9GAMM|nr:MAG: putative short-chain dehydrogenase [Marinobacter excellens HL-55]
MWTLITGAGSGIGRSLALELARKGHDLILAGRTAVKLDEVAETIRQDVPERKVRTFTVELADTASTQKLAMQVCESADRLAAFVYCAGAGEPAADLASLQLSDFQEALAVNVSAPLLLTQSLLPVLCESGKASRIVMVGAGIDKHAQPGTGSYGISKMAMRRLVQQLSVEFGAMEAGPIVSLFQPGLVDTPGIRDHVSKACALNLPHGPWLKDRLDSGRSLTAEQAATAIWHADHLVGAGGRDDLDGRHLKVPEKIPSGRRTGKEDGFFIGIAQHITLPIQIEPGHVVSSFHRNKL